MSGIHFVTTSQVVLVVLLVIIVLSWRKHLQHLEKCHRKQSALFAEGSDGAVFEHKWPKKVVKVKSEKVKKYPSAQLLPSLRSSNWGVRLFRPNFYRQLLLCDTTRTHTFCFPGSDATPYPTGAVWSKGTSTISSYQLPISRLSRPPSVLLSPKRTHCSKQTYLLVVLTRVDDPSVRTVFRSTYGRFATKYNFITVFPLGLSNSENVNNDVKKEHKKHGDILQSDFLDAYGNLTLKTYSYSNYVRQHCMGVRVVLKVDDDLAWNVGSMFAYLSEIADEDNVVLHCRSVKNPLVSRDVNERWYVTPEEYPYKYFPKYCLSPVYAATPRTIAAMANATVRIPHLWLDDVWSLGLVAWEAGATFRPLSFNVEREIFEPFLNGSVIAQYFGRNLDGLYLFHTVNARLLS